MDKLDHGLNAEKATTELCPPKPNEFEMAAKYDEVHFSKSINSID